MTRCESNMRGRLLLVLILLAVDFLTSNIFIHTGSILLHFFSSHAKLSFQLGYTRRVKEPITNVIILSHSRSGSSFLGQIFNHHPDVFYVYEPLHVLKITTLGQSSFYESSALQLLNDILTCNFENHEEFLTFVANFPHQRYSSRAFTVPFCIANQINFKIGKARYVCRPLDTMYTSRVCSSFRHRVIKLLTHRIPKFSVNFFEPLMKPQLNVKIIQLVRDPRAIVASMEKSGWIQSYTRTNNFNLSKNPSLHFEQRVKMFCLSMIDTIKFILEAKKKLFGRYRLVRYEDLVEHMPERVDGIMKFAQFRSSDDVTQWINRSTHAHSVDSSQPNYDYSTVRTNISQLIIAWQRNLDREQIIIVEKYCKPVMTVLHYPALFPGHVHKEFRT